MPKSDKGAKSKNRIRLKHNNYFQTNFNTVEDVRELLTLVLDDEEIENCDMDSLKIESNVLTGSNLAGKYSDLLVKVKTKNEKTNIHIHILVDHKSSPDKRVMRQLLNYLGNKYAHKKTQVVLPVILYHGQKAWKKEKTFYTFEHQNLPQWLLRKRGRKLVDFEADFLNLKELEASGRLTHLSPEIGLVMHALLYNWEAGAKEFVSWLDRFRLKSIEKANDRIRSTFNYFGKKHKRVTMAEIGQVFEEQYEGDEYMQHMKMTLENMSPQSFREAHKTGREEGREEGRKEGREEGRVEGLKQGEEIGREKAVSEFAANLVRLGYETDDICRMTNLDREAVEVIRKISSH